MFKNNYLYNSPVVLMMFDSAARALAQEAAGYLSRTICYTPDQYTAFIKSEPAKWGKAVKASGAKVD